MTDVPRLRMFAGPNGSGKSTIKSVIRPELLGLFINPDELEKEAREKGVLDLKHFGIAATEDEALTFFRDSTLLRKSNLAGEAFHFADGALSFRDVKMNAYIASVAADFIRHKLLEQRTSFSFETVMSSPDKIAFLARARAAGYRTYLYYVATKDPSINISRVRNRVLLGGHSVPEDKIVSRYGRSLNLLVDAIRQSSRAYVFDNSELGPVWLAEITDGGSPELKADVMPMWFKAAVWDKLSADVSD